MKLAISQIAWKSEEEESVAQLLASMGIDKVELAPPRLFSDPENPKKEEMRRCLRFWSAFGISPTAFQALLFGRPDLLLFFDSDVREAMFKHLSRTIAVAGQMGIPILVFGSPKNRFVPDSLSGEEAWDIAVDFFGRLGKVAFESGTNLCIEPNPGRYGCNFITNAEEGIEFVRSVATPGFGLHLDLAGLWLADDDIVDSIRASKEYLKHFHLSAPDLECVEKNNGLPYLETIYGLLEVGFSGSVSIEMRSHESGNLDAVRHAVDFLSEILNTHSR
jgi:sugar phosphate isomerase/epimerase